MIGTDLNKEAAERSENAVRTKLLDSIMDANPFPVPESMTDRYIESLKGNPDEMDEEQLLEAKKEIEPQAKHVVKRILLVDRIAELESLESTKVDLEKRIDEIAEQTGEKAHKIRANL